MNNYFHGNQDEAKYQWLDENPYAGKSKRNNVRFENNNIQSRNLSISEQFRRDMNIINQITLNRFEKTLEAILAGVDLDITTFNEIREVKAGLIKLKESLEKKKAESIEELDKLNIVYYLGQLSQAEINADRNKRYKKSIVKFVGEITQTILEIKEKKEGDLIIKEVFDEIIDILNIFFDKTLDFLEDGNGKEWHSFQINKKDRSIDITKHSKKTIIKEEIITETI